MPTKTKKSIVVKSDRNENQSTGTGIYSLFVPSDKAKKANEKVTVKSMSPMIKPSNWPEGMALRGVFKKFFECGNFKEGRSEKKGTGIEIVPEGADVGVAIALVATLRQGLEVSGDGNAATSPHLGKEVIIEKMPDKLPSKKGNDAWHFLVAIVE